MTKLDVLKVLSRAGELDAVSISRRLSATPEATGMMLLRQVRDGLIRRELDRGIFVYSLTPKGEARHVYLNAREHGLAG